ncbi:MAG: nickel pincer cofactor biosynthesis protein LarB [Nitrospinaceae bacterium]|nr:nickel pincer cofactor biosynthesis protein LarB [Nitrospinaceae bacterium]
MNQKELEIILINVQKNKLSPADAIKQLQNMPYENIDFAKIDHHRELRNGLPEVIYGQGKSIPQLKKIIQSLKKGNSDTLATKISNDTYKKLKTSLPKDAKYNEQAQTLVIRNKKIKQPAGLITIITAGTSDIPIAEEALVTADLLGSRVETIFDVGVAGLHRLLDNIEQIKKARVLIVVAGMEGALASVVGGLVSQPIIAVPTSIGYGASFNGISALLTMLNSCAPGIAVVNIDNGFGAGCMAHRINILAEQVSENG